MSEEYLHRHDAPFGDKVWEKIDETVTGAAKSVLCGRRLLQTLGPYGLGLKALPSGDKAVDEKTIGGTEISASCVTPLAVIRSGFTLPVRDIAGFEPLRVFDFRKPRPVAYPTWGHLHSEIKSLWHLIELMEKNRK